MLRKIIVPFLVSAVFIAFTLWLSGFIEYAGFSGLVDMPSFLVSIVVPYALASIGFGFAATRAAYRAPFDSGSGRKELASARAYFRSLTRYIVAWAVFAIVTGFIALLVASSGDSAGMGKNVAICILSALYAAVILILFVIPFQAAIDGRLAETD